MVVTTTRRRARDQADAAHLGWIGAGVLLLALGALVVVSVWRNGGFAYPLDDTYIHLRLADNLRHGTLGVNPGEFASAGSSAIWPVLLSGVVAIVGPLVGVPLALDAALGAALLVVLDRWARARGLTTRERIALQTGMLVVVPLPVIAMTGMEHVLQIAACLLLVALVTERAVGWVDTADGEAGPSPTSWRRDLWIGAAALLAAATRLEVVLLLVPLAALLALHRRWRTLWVMLGASAIPVAVTAAVNLGQGWPALPASVLMKSIAAESTSGPARLLPSLPAESLRQPRLFAIGALVVLLWWWSRRGGAPRWAALADGWAAVCVVGFALHLGYVSAPGSPRYEAYLVALAVVSCVVSAHSILVAPDHERATPPRAARVVALGLAGVALLGGMLLFPKASQAMSEIHSQQLQMASFVARSCPGCTVVANDIGALSMYSGAHVLDDYGLANEDVLRAKLDSAFDAQVLDDWASEQGADMAVVYDDPYWLPGVPDRWQRLGTWTVDTQVVVGGRTVSFFSLDPTRTDELRDALRDADLPSHVAVRIDG